jgi:argininosuccinate synthase
MKIVLAYSGGLDTSVLLSWIKETYNAEMIAFCANIGQEEELKGLDKKAKRTGASKIYIDDLQEEFARDFIFPMIRAGAIYEGQYFLGTSIARPLIAKRMVEIARARRPMPSLTARRAKGNDQVRFELTAAALAPELQVIAPWRDERFRKDFPGRQEMIDYCAQENSGAGQREETVFDGPQPLHISYEAGILEDPWMDASDKRYRGSFTTLSVFPEDAPDKPSSSRSISERERRGGERQSDVAARRDEDVEQLGGKHGVGRVDMVENRYVGMKSRGVYETPGGAILHFAHRQIESLTMDREVMHLRDSLIPKYASWSITATGFAGASRVAGARRGIAEERDRHGAREALQGGIYVTGRKSPVSLYNPAHRHDGGRPDESLQPGRCDGLHPAERPALESRGEGAEKEIAMGKVRRGGFMFLWWIGDHTPRHIHVFDKNGRLITRVNLETMEPMDIPSVDRKILEIIRELRDEGRL